MHAATVQSVTLSRDAVILVTLSCGRIVPIWDAAPHDARIPQVGDPDLCLGARHRRRPSRTE